MKKIAGEFKEFIMRGNVMDLDVGVIIGDDLRFENGSVITDFTKRAKTDQSLRGIKKLSKEDPEMANARADEIIRNTYRTLLTRGMKGCYIYCTDPGLRDYLRGRLRAYADGIFKLSGQLPAAVQTETEAHSSVLM